MRASSMAVSVHAGLSRIRKSLFTLDPSKAPAFFLVCTPPKLAVFDARFNMPIPRIDKSAEGCGVCHRPGSQLHMTHELAGALQQAGRIRQRCAVKETHVDVRSEYINVAERRISQTCNRTAVMQELSNFVP